MQKKEKILLTGATGFIGRFLTGMLLCAGHDVRCFVRKTSDIEFLKNTKAEIVVGDLNDYESIDTALKDIDTVFHLAALSRPPKVFFFRPFFKKIFHNVNTRGTLWIYDLAKKHKVKNFIFFSSVSASKSWQVAGGISQTEYAKSKEIAEKHLLKEAAKNDMRTIVISPGQVFGEGSLGIANFYKLIAKGLFVIMGNGKNKMPIIYVKDIAAAAVAAYEKGKNGTNYYIYKETIIFNDYISKIKKALNSTAKNIKFPLTFAVTIAIIKECFERLLFIKICPFTMDFGLGGVKSVAATFTGNNQSTKDDLNFNPPTDTVKGIANAAAWCRTKGLIK